MDIEEVAQLRRAVGRLTRVLNAAATSEGLTPAQSSVLGLLSSRGPMALATVTELEQLNPTMVSRIVKKLVDRGLITRVQDDTDQRSARLEVTQSGRKVHDEIRKRRTELVSGCVDRLPPAHATALHRAIPALTALADELPHEDGSGTRVDRA